MIASMQPLVLKCIKGLLSTRTATRGRAAVNDPQRVMPLGAPQTCKVYHINYMLCIDLIDLRDPLADADVVEISIMDHKTGG